MMNFKITDIEYYSSSDLAKIDNILFNYGISFQEMENLLKSHIFTHSYKSFQEDLAKQLADLLKKFFQSKPQNISYNKPYSKDFDSKKFKPDVVIEHKENKKAIFIEVEFRPDSECKDIVKFQIGHKCGTLALGILIVAKNRDNINCNYTTMPEFSSCKKIIGALKPECPILLIGFDGCKLI